MSNRRIEGSQATPDDLQFMAEAVQHARILSTRPWPNPPVGALVIRDGIEIGRGAHHGAGLDHAERVALAAAGVRARGATLYCTLEPCNHHGRTPPCTDAILAAGVARIVYGVADPNGEAAGGARRLREAGLDVTGGVHAGACLDLIWPFVCTDQFARPYVELKTAVSLDGRFAAVDSPVGAPVYLTGESARRDVHRRRCWVDLVLVGHGTARQDRPRLDTRLADAPEDGPRAEPEAGCMVGRIGSNAVLNRPHWLAFHARGLPIQVPPEVESIACEPDRAGRPTPQSVVEAAAARGMHAVMVEGGPTLAAAFLSAGLVDRWVQYVAPVVLGAGPTWPDWRADAGSGFHQTRCGALGPDMVAVWDRRDFHASLKALTPDGKER